MRRNLRTRARKSLGPSYTNDSIDSPALPNRSHRRHHLRIGPSSAPILQQSISVILVQQVQQVQLRWQ
jgi:hypothetical protein